MAEANEGTEEGALKRVLSSPLQINITKKKKAGLVPDPQTLHITPIVHQVSWAFFFSWETEYLVGGRTRVSPLHTKNTKKLTVYCIPNQDLWRPRMDLSWLTLLYLRTCQDSHRPLPVISLWISYMRILWNEPR